MSEVGEVTWEARERVVVALTGGPEGDTLVRRAARIAARDQDADLLAVHVTPADADAPGLARLRALVESLGGSYHHVVGEDVPRALIDFARGVNATQLVLGASRRGRFAQIMSRGVGVTIIALSGSIDVHMVTHEEASRGRPGWSHGRTALTPGRRVAGWVMAVAGIPALTAVLLPAKGDLAPSSEMLLLLFAVVGVALTGGMWPALTAAVGASLLLNLFYTPPVGLLAIADPENILALVVFVLVAVAVSVIVDIAARRTREAARATAEAELLSTLAGHVLRGEAAVSSLLARMRETFGLTSVTLLERRAEPSPDNLAEPERWRIVATSGGPPATCPAAADTVVVIDEQLVLTARGRPSAAADRRVLEAFATEAAVALRHERLAREAERARPLAAADRMRTALLAAVSHDLRTPLASAKAAVDSLADPGIAWSGQDRAELLGAARQSLAKLERLVVNLLDMSRLQAGVLGVDLQPTSLADVLPGAVDDLDRSRDRVESAVGAELPEVLADPALLERVLANLMANAVRYSPPGEKVLVTASRHAAQVEVRVADRGPGIPREAYEQVFLPFQRFGDRDNHAGVGLGLALSRGLAEAMGGTLMPDRTPGGGLTMILTLSVAS
ncbi:DUF4118 domain-containing protein [Nonomuraea glycinis]|uniref:DUF4118 domain-containing protein n=1 Tax=Nonomuraea glycinis TaxID=2047744 RepID=UPI0033A621B4